MTKEFYMSIEPNTYGAMMKLMETGHQLMEKDATIKDFIVEVDWKEDHVSLYICREETK